MKFTGKALFLALTISSFGLYSQKASVETASLSLRAWGKADERIDIRIHNLNEAKKHIDMAFENPSTSNDPKMWLIRARTYLALQTDTLAEGKKSSSPHPDAIIIAAESMLKCHQIDASHKFSRSAEAYTAFVHISANARYLGDLAFNEKNFEKAVKYYQATKALVPYDDEALLKRQNITEDGLLYNIATTQKLAGQNEEAKKSFNELIARKYNDPWIYLELYQIYLETDKDTVKAIETINKGREAFEEDANLRKQQIFIYSVTGRSQELVTIMDQNISAEPYNAGNYFLRGLLFSEQADLAKNNNKTVEASELSKKAESDYLKAIEYDDELLDAHEELGKYYFNTGAAIAEEAGKLGLKEVDKYNKMNEEVKMYFEKSIPHFEKIFEYSSEARQKNQSAQVLKSMYLKTEQMDKYNALKKELEGQ